MPHLIVHPPPVDADVFESRFAAIRDELRVPAQFPAAVQEAAEKAVADGGLTRGVERVDAQHLPFVAIDPPGATDLDQAFAAEARAGGGYRVHYAIADVAAFVDPGGVIDQEARARGVTLYSPDMRTPLHPPVISEDRASLLPGVPRPALLWQIDLDSDGAITSAHLQRATIQVREAISYAEAQRRIDDGSADLSLALLAPIGRLRQEQEADRGGVSINLPAQEIVGQAESYSLVFERSLEIESWNAHISLLTGIVAGRTMVDAQVGIVRTLPEVDPDAITALRLTAQALDLPWDKDTPYASFVRGLAPNNPQCNAFLVQSTRVLRGAGYVAFHGEAPEYAYHSAIASVYAHVTAPLRRLVDRFANEILLCLYADRDPAAHASWAVEALDALPSLMGSARQRSSSLERATLDAAEAMTLAPRVGEKFPGLVVDVTPSRNQARIQITQPAVVATIDALDPASGTVARRLAERVTVELVSVDVQDRSLDFRVVEP